MNCLLEGLTYQQIANRLGIKRSTVYAHVKTLFRMYDVHSRGELVDCVRNGGQPRDLRKADPKPEKQKRTPQSEIMQARRADILHRLRSGKTYHEIAEAMNLTVYTVKYHAMVIYREQGVENLKELKQRIELKQAS